MKKFILNGLVVFTAVCIFSAFVSCRYDNDSFYYDYSKDVDRDPVDTEDYILFEDDGYIEEAKIEHKNRLINIAKTEQWKTSDTVIKAALSEIITGEMQNYAGISNPTFSERKTETLSVKPLANDDRSSKSKISECKEFELIIYDINASSFKWHAITSTDKRIGNVIALIESEYKEDISDCDFAVDFKERLGEYVQQIADVWNSITDEDLNNSSKNLRTPPPYIVDPDYEFDNWKRHGGNNSHILKTKWGQSSPPFNSCVQAVKGSNIGHAGCVTVQVGQILAFHKYTKQSSTPNLATIKRSWQLAKDWDGKYDWDVLTKEVKPNDSSLEKVKIQVGALLYDIAEGCKAKYENDSTGITNYRRNKYLKKKCGYKYNSTSNYSLKKIKKSIDAGCPVPITGSSKKGKTGHAFIVDGYSTLSCTATKKNSSEEPIQIMDEFVHCNLGWKGDWDGYYLSGVFAIYRGSLTSDENISRSAEVAYYYQYDLKQLNMLRPK